MEQVFHNNATTILAIGKETLEAPAKVSTPALLKRYGINFRTVQQNGESGLQSIPNL